MGHTLSDSIRKDIHSSILTSHGYSVETRKKLILTPVISSGDVANLYTLLLVLTGVSNQDILG